MTNAPPKRRAPARTGAASQPTSPRVNQKNGAGATAAMISGHERCLLAFMLSGAGDELPVTPDILSPPHRKICSAIVSLPGSQRNLLAVQDALIARGELEEVGGAAGLTAIACETTSPEIAQYALGEVLDYSRKRRAAEIGERLQKGDISPDDAQEQLLKLNAPRRGLPPIEDAAELISKPIVRPDDVIEGVAHRGAKILVGGASKSFKTWTLSDLGICVATGTNWLGKFPTKRGPVLFTNLEIQSSFFAKRIQTICDERQLAIEPGYLRVWNLRGHAADLSTLLPRLLQQIGRDQYVLIVVDPVYKLLGARDENKAGDIASLLNEVERLAVVTGAAVTFGAHYSKGNQAAKESIDRVGGSGVFARDPDSILNFTRHEQADCFTVDATLRNHPPITPFVVRWEYPLTCVESALDPARLKQAGAAVKQYDAAELVELLARPMSAAEFRKVADNELGMSRATFFRLFGALKTSGAITSSPGEKWKRT